MSSEFTESSRLRLFGSSSLVEVELEVKGSPVVVETDDDEAET